MVDLSKYMLNNDADLEIKLGLPREVVFCKKCVISNQRPTTTIETTVGKDQQNKPTIAFDEKGVCDACRWAEKKAGEVDWDKREAELEMLLDRFRSKDGSFDVVVPSSGGKDSGYVAHLLKHEYGMNPLTVTWAPNMCTEIGRVNFDNTIKAGFPNILITPSGNVHAYLTRLAFLNIGHPFQPFNLGQKNIGPQVARQYGIKLIFYGENVAEYGNNLKDNLIPKMNRRLFTNVDIDDDNLKFGGVTIKELREKHGIKRSDLLSYASISEEEMAKTGIEMHYMSYYKRWIQQENYYYAADHLNFEVNTERTQGTYSKYQGLDDKMEPFHFYMYMIKFGLGRASWDAAAEIRTGHITRDEGIRLVRRYDTEFPDRYFDDFLDYTDIDREAFWATVNRFRSPHLWKYQGGQWHLRHQIH